MTTNKFEWDNAKAASNLIKHGVNFNDAVNVFNDPFRVTFDIRSGHDRKASGDGEIRYKAIGVVRGDILAVVYTIRGYYYRIISARRASKNERKAYNKN